MMKFVLLGIGAKILAFAGSLLVAAQVPAQTDLATAPSQCPCRR
jgi:hypothetical protein